MAIKAQRVMRAMIVVAIGCGAGGVALAQQGPGNLPFSSIYRRPTISPYNQIANFSQNPMQNQNVYQQMVLPQLQQQQQQIEQLNQSRKLKQIQNQVQQIQRDTSARQVDESIRPTGHRATFQNLSHFYPPTR